MEHAKTMNDSMLAINNVHPSMRVKTSLLEKGYKSSVNIYQMPESEFIDSVLDIMSKEEAEEVYKKASHNYTLLLHMVTALNTSYGQPVHKALRSRMGIGEDNLFEDIPSYQEIFGGLDYCKCPKCKSIFGPAAYFVDLFRIIRKHVGLETREGAATKAVLLEERRKDLFSLSLSCKNTNEVKPYLEIVNQITQAYLKERMNCENLFKEMTSIHFPFFMPFNLLLEKLNAWLAESGISYKEILDLFGCNKEEAAAAGMGITVQFYKLLENPIDQTMLPGFFGLTEDNIENLSNLEYFLQITQLSQQELIRILYQDLEETEQTKHSALLHHLFINEVLEQDDAYVYIEQDTIYNLNYQTLERFYRFLKLSRLLGVGYAELNWLIHIIRPGKEGILPLEEIWQVINFAKKTSIDIEIASALIGPVKDYGNDLFYRSFNRTRKELEAFTEESDLIRILCKELSMDFESLHILTQYLGQGQACLLDAVYRHQKMAQYLALNMKEYTALLTVAFPQPVWVFTVEQAERLFQLRLQAYFNIWDLQYIVYGVKSPYTTLSFSLEDFGKSIELLRRNVTKECKEDEKQLTDYIIHGLSECFQCSIQEQADIMDCIMEEKEQKSWMQKIVNPDIPIEELKENALILSKYVLIAKLGIPTGVLLKISKFPGHFGIDDKRNLNLQNVLDIAGFYHEILFFQDQEQNLLRFVEAYATDNLDVSILAQTAGWEEETITFVCDLIYPGGSREQNITVLIQRLSGCIEAINKLGLNEKSMRSLLSISNFEKERYEEVEKTVEVLVAPSMNSGLCALIEAKKRDALLPLTLMHLKKRYRDITDYNKLYKYFLIDVQMDDKTLISPVKEGINALQLYLQRCRMHLERGVLEISIPESWWSWIMDYRMWEANRKIFVYPENYLLPSIRHSKTNLYQQVEDALQQSKITDSYIEAQYVKYLDEYFNLTQLKICGAYETIVDYYNVLYLFARTKQEPYTYYFCKRVSTLAWTEWKKVDTNIDSETITPVYVFNRLHIFWSSVKETAKVKVESGESLKGGNQRTYSLQIKYTYLNLQDKWIAPQTLCEDEIIYARDDQKNAKEFQEKTDRMGITMEDNSFKKLTLLKLNQKNLYGFLDKDKDYECLMVITGSFAQNLGNPEEGLSPDSTLDREQTAFTAKLNRMIQNSNYEVRNFEDGYFCTGYLKIFNEDLEEETFLHKNEFFVVDGYIPTRHSLIYTALYDEIHRAVGVYFSQSILKDTALPAEGILPYENNCKDPKRPKLSEQSFVIYNEKGDALIDEILSKEIFDKLKNEDIIDTEFHTDEKMLANTDLLNLLNNLLVDTDGGACKNNQILEVQNILLKNIGAVYLFKNADKVKVIPVVNQPGKFIYDCGDEAFLVYPVYQEEGNYYPVDIQKIDAGVTVGIPITANTFVKLGYDLQKARQIFKALQKSGIINQYGIVDMNICNRNQMESVLGKIIPKTQDDQKDDQKKQLDKIYGKIMNLPLICSKDLMYITGISEEKICNTLLDEKIQVLYPWSDEESLYRIDLTMLKQKNNVLFTNNGNGILQDHAVEEIYQKLSDAVSSVNLNYRINENLPEAFTSLPFREWKFKVQRLTNPTIKKLKRKLETGGIPSFLNRKTQSEPSVPIMPFTRLGPSENVVFPKALDGAQIDFEGLYSEYNWELFYHIPVTIAQCFRSNAMNEESMKWFHYVFNPTNQREQAIYKYYWNFLPFAQSDSSTMEQILKDPSGIQAYNDSPFDPHAIARLRIDAYAKYTVMEYVSNIIQWGDTQFMRNTWESLTSATMMYVWAHDLLGKRPREIKKSDKKEELCFQKIEEAYKTDHREIPQFILDLEKQINLLQTDFDYLISSNEIPFNDIQSYFGIPENAQILQLWDIIDDRLYKIRNSLDINGASRITALFEEPLNPRELAQAAYSAGGSLPGALMRKPVRYPYRFTYMIEQAKALTAQLIQLGSSMLAALEKNDAEALLNLTASQEATVLRMTTAIRENRLKEIESGIQSLTISKESANIRQQYYEKNAAEYMSTKEIASFAAAEAAEILRSIGGVMRFSAGIAHLAPQVGSPFAMKYGGAEIGSSLEGAAAGYEVLAGISSHVSQRMLTMAQYDRRCEEWKLQQKQAQKEVENLEKQIESARIQEKAAQRELEIHTKTMEQKKEVLQYLKTKFTSVQLYQWVLGKLSSTMWQTYQLALELALSAQAAYQYEQDEQESFLHFDYWDSGHKGLLAGECLMLALQQMQQSYHKKNGRRLEIEKNISMKAFLPEQLAELKENGVCQFELGEELFARDYPGCYRRKITSISLSIPAILPPYETVKATLKQLSSHILLMPDKSGADYLFHISEEMPDAGIVNDVKRYGEKIAISNGLDDHGVFNLNFNDERYLPFEGTGAASGWILEMPKENNRFDLETITDIIIHIKYTAMEDEQRQEGSFYQHVCKRLRGVR